MGPEQPTPRVPLTHGPRQAGLQTSERCVQAPDGPVHPGCTGGWLKLHSKFWRIFSDPSPHPFQSSTHPDHPTPNSRSHPLPPLTTEKAIQMAFVKYDKGVKVIVVSLRQRGYSLEEINETLDLKISGDSLRQWMDLYL
ncbi:hypothetical protein PCANC_10516 [Puccinia coronata f. sp. avenae]|uniref:Uncharacterized protein n=1 Tax=Puccinia coronata f. sp. avenae TaxID=200324 RepID=A0A2N5VZ73_9BASI|nr:hypothetical protein PCANC_10516 [Puccinia coronata f. sp. avenae]